MKKRYVVNDNAVVEFDPEDKEFAARLSCAVETLNRKYNFYQKRMGTIGGGKQAFEFGKKQDEEMRAIIDGLFGAPVCADLFGYTRLCAIADGQPIWRNFMEAVADKVRGKQDGKN